MLGMPQLKNRTQDQWQSAQAQILVSTVWCPVSWRPFFGSDFLVCFVCVDLRFVMGIDKTILGLLLSPYYAP